MSRELVDALAGLNVAEAVSLAVALFSASLVPFFLLMGMRFDAVHQVVVHAGHNFNRARWASRNAVLDAAALLILLTCRPKGAMS